METKYSGSQSQSHSRHRHIVVFNLWFVNLGVEITKIRRSRCSCHVTIISLVLLVLLCVEMVARDRDALAVVLHHRWCSGDPLSSFSSSSTLLGVLGACRGARRGNLNIGRHASGDVMGRRLSATPSTHARPEKGTRRRRWSRMVPPADAKIVR